MKKRPVIIISGPTATGKTGISLFAAKSIEREFRKKVVIVNFDSLLFYKEISIGTAKPTQEEMKDVSHELIDIVSIADPLNASKYIEKAEDKIKELHQQDKIVILVGGSAFYLRALLKGMYQGVETPKEIKEQVEKTYQENGIEPIRHFLKENDHASFENLHKNDHYRLIRAYEFFLSTNKPLSKEKERMEEKNPYDFSQHKHSSWDILNIYLDLPKEEHLKVIEDRAKKMMQQGLENEVRELLEKGFTGDEKALNSIGYKETTAYIRGELNSLEDCIERISISTRQLAKSQRTFFNKITPKRTYHSQSDRDRIMDDILNFLADKI